MLPSSNSVNWLLNLQPLRNYESPSRNLSGHTHRSNSPSPWEQGHCTSWVPQWRLSSGGAEKKMYHSTGPLPMTKSALSQLPLPLLYCGFKAALCSDSFPMPGKFSSPVYVLLKPNRIRKSSCPYRNLVPLVAWPNCPLSSEGILYFPDFSKRIERPFCFSGLILVVHSVISFFMPESYG